MYIQRLLLTLTLHKKWLFFEIMYLFEKKLQKYVSKMHMLTKIISWVVFNFVYWLVNQLSSLWAVNCEFEYPTAEIQPEHSTNKLYILTNTNDFQPCFKSNWLWLVNRPVRGISHLKVTGSKPAQVKVLGNYFEVSKHLPIAGFEPATVRSLV